ncbi:MAG: B12-binding domain-containing radical SAM protein, partial [Bacillota bacterium]
SMKVKWFGQSSLQIAQDEELLDLAADSGCIGLFIGFESLVAENLRRVGKGLVNRVEGFLDSINMIHQRGIGIEGAFIFGMDDDDPSVFEKTVRFAEKSKLALAQFGILTPFPGTPLYEDMQAEGRIIDGDWSKYTISNVVAAPANLSKKALEEGFRWAYREFYSYRSMLKRLFPSFGRSFWLFLGLNMVFKRVADRMVSARKSMAEQTVGES